MSSVFSLDNVENFTEKLNLDELYERKQIHDKNELDLYNKLLNRVHVKIKTASKHSQLCWFLVPEIIIGVPKYNQGNCIGYIFNKLKDNGFRVRYIDPNLLMISWAHYVPSYVRTEFKRKTGIAIDENGNEKPTASEPQTKLPLGEMLSTKQPKQQREYLSTSNYKPSGKLF